MNTDPNPQESAGQPPPLPPSLSELRAPEPAPTSDPQSGLKKAGGIIATIGVLAAKYLGAIKVALLPLLKFAPFLVKTVGTMFISIAVYATIFGWKWAVGFVVLIFIHECGHLVAAKSFGLKVGLPVFIPFMGAFIALKEAPPDVWIEACVGIGGPVAGSLGALLCHSAGEILGMPLLISLAWMGYWLNLFNLTPSGTLDGGRIVGALSPWFWLPGLGILGYMAFTRPSFIIILVLIGSVPRVISLFRPKTDEDRRYYQLDPVRRWTMGVSYFGLMAALAFGMHVAQSELESMGIRSHSRTQVAQAR